MDFATGAMGTLLPKLGNLLLDEYNLKDRVKQGVKNLKAELECMEAALLKVSDMPLDQLDPQVKIWANEVRELSYVIEDSLDLSMVCVDGLEPTKPYSFKGFVKKTRNKVTKFKARHKIANDINYMKIHVSEVKERYERYKISDVVANVATTTVDPRLLTMYNKVSDLVGMDKAVDELTKKLSEGNDPLGKKLKVISIVGFGGLGKTTLAKHVREKINKSFDCGGFVPVGRKPDKKKALKDILLELDKQMYMDASEMDERQLINQLREFLTDKRYLFVIDDIWDMPTWEMINCAMVDSCSGSRIILTTRICGVAEKVGGVYNMKALSDEYSKTLFFSRIFGGDQGIILDNQYDELVNKILWRCGGVPLSIITIASLLAGKRREDWSEVYDSIGFRQENNEVVENTRKIVSFSYYDLPFCLKTCLLHLSTSPEDTTIGKETLIWMWIAEGFIPDKPGTRLFELGESYLNELVNRNMIQLVETSRIGRASFCSVHDMVHDLICTLSSQLNFITIYDNQKPITFLPSNSVRRLALSGGSMGYNPVMEMGQVRSFNAVYWQNSGMPSLLSFKVLRVLVIHKCDFSMGVCDLDHLSKLVHLRYLELVHTPAAELPIDIGHDLKFLQTLIIVNSAIKELPPSIGELSNLMCLRASEGTRLMSEIGKLTSLEELVLRSAEKSPNFFTRLGNLREMRILNIRFDEIDERALEDMVESLASLRRVQELTIRFESEERIQVKDIWEEWTPPSELCRLSLERIVLPRRPLWLDSSCVPYLSSLWLEVEVVAEQDLQILGALLSLRCLYLRICEMKGFSYTIGSGEFLKLIDLDTNMEISTSGEGVLPMLEELISCPTVGRHDYVALMLENMPSLQHVSYELDCQHCTSKEAKEAESALRNTTKIHPNHPTVKIERINQVDDDDDDDDDDDGAGQGPEEVSVPDKELLQPALENSGADDKTTQMTSNEEEAAANQP